MDFQNFTNSTFINSPSSKLTYLINNVLKLKSNSQNKLWYHYVDDIITLLRFSLNSDLNKCLSFLNNIQIEFSVKLKDSNSMN